MKNNVSKHHLRKFFTVLLILMLLLATTIGLLLVFSPYLENREHKLHVQQEVKSFKELVSVNVPEKVLVEVEREDKPITAPSTYTEVWLTMQEYNTRLYENGQKGMVDAWSYEGSGFELTEYGFTNRTSVGLVTIPKIKVELPLFLGADYTNLANGFAQLYQTSMPIGGNNTNCVLACHRGWNGMAYMRDVEMLDIGDPIYVQNLWETMEYRIDEILLIEADDLETIRIQENRDLLTIVTCHPYGVGSHRYILICERFEEPPVPVVTEVVTDNWVWQWHDRVKISVKEGLTFESSQWTIFVSVYLPWFCTGIALLLIICSVLIVATRRKKGENKSCG